MEQSKVSEDSEKAETKPFLDISKPHETEPCCTLIVDNGENSTELFYKFPSPEKDEGLKREVSSFERENDKEEPKGCQNYFGILLALFAGFVFTVGTILAKYMKHYHPFTLAMFRVQGFLIPSVLMMLYAVWVKKIPVAEPIWPLTDKTKRKTLAGIILRSALGCTALFLHFGALKYLQVGDVAVINSCKPIFVTVAAFVFLGESCGIFPVLMALLTIVGVGVITRPPILTGEEAFDLETLNGAGFAMASVITDTFVVVIVRSLKRIHVSIMMFFVGLWATFQSILCAYLVDELKFPESGRDWGFAAGMAAVAILNQAAMHMALQLEQANPISVTRTMDFIFAFLLQFLVMNVTPDLFSFTGAAIIIMCVLLTAFRKYLSTLHKSHPYRKKFRILLI